MSFSEIWTNVGVPQKIAADQIHVWGWLLDSSLSLAAIEEAQIRLLDAKELERFHRFHFACDRARFAIAHANVRRILGAYLDREPEHLLFRTNPFGKPELIEDAKSRPLHFNLSHS